jgi:hypothetical protein
MPPLLVKVKIGSILYDQKGWEKWEAKTGERRKIRLPRSGFVHLATIPCRHQPVTSKPVMAISALPMARILF